MYETTYLLNDFNTDWLPEYGDQTNDHVIRNRPRLFSTDNCSCAISSHCYDPLLVGPTNLSLPGLFIGCTVMRGLRKSTLECFYSSNCIDTIVAHLHYYTEANGTVSMEQVDVTDELYRFTPISLNLSSNLPNASIGSMIDQFFIDRWISNASYEDYLNYCSPSVCQYSFVSRQDLITVIMYTLSFYGGLTFAWRFIIWNSVRILNKCQ